MMSVGETEKDLALKSDADAAFTRRWGQLSARIGNHAADLMIVLTAPEQGFTVIMRNMRHFSPGSRLTAPPPPPR